MKVINRRRVKTRKPHRCWGCAHVIHAGTEVEMSVSEDMGQVASSYWCKTCEKFLETLDVWDRADGFDFGGLLEYDDYPKEGSA